jgi:hypothetical protein
MWFDANKLFGRIITSYDIHRLPLKMDFGKFYDTKSEMFKKSRNIRLWKKFIHNIN